MHLDPRGDLGHRRERARRSEAERDEQEHEAGADEARFARHADARDRPAEIRHDPDHEGRRHRLQIELGPPEHAEEAHTWDASSRAARIAGRDAERSEEDDGEQREAARDERIGETRGGRLRRQPREHAPERR